MQFPDTKIPDISKQLNDYYAKRKHLIEDSIESIVPLICTEQSMNHLVGEVDYRWDLPTLQKTFFKPLHEYLNKRTPKILGLSTCLFLEAAGMKLEKFIPILAIPVFFETSHKIFQDITDWANNDDPALRKMSAPDISIIGNVSIALLTLPSHNLLSHRLDMDNEKTLKLYESLTTNVFNSLFGNGLKLFWEQLKIFPKDFNEYYEAALMLNKGLLRFGGDLWLIFQQQKPDEITVSALNKFIEKRAVSIQLERDLLSFERVQMELKRNKVHHFNPFSNFLFIHAVKKLNINDLVHHKMSAEYFIELSHKAESVKYITEQINEYNKISDNALEFLPIEEKFKVLLESFCDFLVKR
jgi:hypothetical protein